MTHTKTAEPRITLLDLVERLHEATRANRAAWSPTDHSDVYICATPNGSIILRRYTTYGLTGAKYLITINDVNGTALVDRLLTDVDDSDVRDVVALIFEAVHARFTTRAAAVMRLLHEDLGLD